VLNQKDLARELIVQENEKERSLSAEKEVIVVKDFLPARTCTLLEEFVLFKCKHQYGHNSNHNDENCFYTVFLNKKWFLYNYLINEICHTLKLSKLILSRFYANIQYPGMNGTWHVDEGDDQARTALIMLGPTQPKGVGIFQTRDKDIDFERGKLIFFKGRVLHRALSGNNPHYPRITLAFKLTLPEA